jgi:hypothetical protein
VAFLLKIVPKIGPFRALSFKPPSPQMEMYFLQSLMLTTQGYDKQLMQIKLHDVMIPNQDIDTGEPTKFGEYALADKTYAELLDKLANRKFKDVSTSLRDAILRFYASAGTGPLFDVDKKHWKKTQKELEQLKSAVAENDIFPGAPAADDASGD